MCSAPSMPQPPPTADGGQVPPPPAPPNPVSSGAVIAGRSRARGGVASGSTLMPQSRKSMIIPRPMGTTAPGVQIPAAPAGGYGG